MRIQSLDRPLQLKWALKKDKSSENLLPSAALIEEDSAQHYDKSDSNQAAERDAYIGALETALSSIPLAFLNIKRMTTQVVAQEGLPYLNQRNST